MSELTIIDLSTLKTNCQQLDKGINNYKNKAYQSFKCCYINTCQDSTIRSIANKLGLTYIDINNGCTNISEWFNSYVSNTEGLEKILAGESGNVDEPAVSNKFFALPSLDVKTIDDYSNGYTTLGVVNNISKEQSIENANAVFAFTGTGFASFVEGILIGGEAVFDTGIIVSATVETILLFPTDSSNGFKITNKLWDFTNEMVSTSYVKDQFDAFYLNNEIGKFLETNNKYFKDERSVCNELGAAVVIDSLSTIMPAPAAAFTVELGRNTENAWSNGSSTFDGLVGSIVKSAESSLVWYGLGISSGPLAEKFDLDTLQKKYADGAIIKNGRYVAQTVEQKVIKNAKKIGVTVADGIVSPIISSVTDKTYTDPVTGETIVFKDEAEPNDRFVQILNNKGGVKGLIAGAALTPIISKLGENDVNKVAIAVSKIPVKFFEQLTKSDESKNIEKNPKTKSMKDLDKAADINEIKKSDVKNTNVDIDKIKENNAD